CQRRDPCLASIAAPSPPPLEPHPENPQDTPRNRADARPGGSVMKAGIVCLVLAYVLSQFYRAFLAVLTPVLAADLGVTAEDLAAASGLWFLTFAAFQIPVGIALDRIGPRLTTAVIFAV